MSFNDQGGVDHNVKAPIPPYNAPRVRLPDGRVVTAIEPYVFREYPKAALKRATKDDIDTVLRNAENFDERRNVMRYVRRPPRLGELIPLKDPESHQDVVFMNAEEETAFYAMYPDIEKIETGSGAAPVTWEDPEYQEFIKWKAARKENIKQVGRFTAVNEERADLLRRAEAVSLKIDKRWSHDNLRAAVIKAEADKQSEAAATPVPEPWGPDAA